MRNRLIVAIMSAFLFLLDKAFMLTQQHIASPSVRISRKQNKKTDHTFFAVKQAQSSGLPPLIALVRPAR